MIHSAKSNAGFTLIEMLMSVCLLTMIAAALGAFLFASVRAVEDLESSSSAILSDTSFGLEMMAREIQSSPVVLEMPLEGKRDQISLPVLFSTADQAALNSKFRLGQVQELKIGKGFEFQKIHYYFDPAKKALMRQVGVEQAQVFLKKIKELEFAYAIRSVDKKSWGWQSELPTFSDLKKVEAISIKVFIENTARPGRSATPIQKTFFVASYHPLESAKNPV